MCRALILSGYGINCEKEMSAACELAGAKPATFHVKSLLQEKIRLKDFDLLCLPGGFSFGDDLGAAKAFANRLSHTQFFIENLQEFVRSGKCVIGICNGFQLLVKLGILPGPLGQTVTLTYNESHRFEDRWVNHKVCHTHCIFTRGIETLFLPVRHGEGKLVAKDPNELNRLFENGLVPLQYADSSGEATNRYPENPNGSQGAIAALTDSTGRIFGMMAHPEAALFFTNHPLWTKMKEAALRKKEKIPTFGAGLDLFKNAVTYIKETSP